MLEKLTVDQIVKIMFAFYGILSFNNLRDMAAVVKVSVSSAVQDVRR
jgi:hypothetical protein